jgi:protein MAK11
MSLKRPRKDGKARQERPESINKRVKVEKKQPQSARPQKNGKAKEKVVKQKAASNNNKTERSKEAVEQYGPFTEKEFDSFYIVAGSYERLLYGISASPRPKNDNDNGDIDSEQLVLKPVFQFPAHMSCIKAVAGSPAERKGGKLWLATGGTDESVKIWELKKRREVGTLVGHGGKQMSIFSLSSNVDMAIKDILPTYAFLHQSCCSRLQKIPPSRSFVPKTGLC